MSNQPGDDLMDDMESVITTVPEIKNARRYSISKSGRFKQIVKHREALDETLFNDQPKVTDYNESSKSTSNNNNNNNNNNSIKKKKKNSSLGRKSCIDNDIEAWIENSFRPALEDYKTIRKNKNTSTKSNTIDNDGHLETAL